MTVTFTVELSVPELPSAVSVYVVVTEGDIVTLPARETVPIPLSMETELASVTFHSRVVDCPAVMADGAAVNEVITGVPAAITDTVTDAVAEAEPPVAVSVYVVATVGVTVVVPCRGSPSPTPWSIDTDVAPLTFHRSVACSPALIVTGLLVKELIVNAAGGATVTMTLAVTEPAVPVAVRV